MHFVTAEGQSMGDVRAVDTFFPPEQREKSFLLQALAENAKKTLKTPRSLVLLVVIGATIS